MQLFLAHLSLDLAHLRVGLPLLQARKGLETRFVLSGRVARVLGANQVRPAPFQCRACALVHSPVAVQVCARRVALSLLVAGNEPSHLTIIPRQR